MALSPGIPTSFVPRQPVQPTRRPTSSGTNLFLIASLIIAGLVIAVAVGVFAYNKFLLHTLASKQAELTTAQSQVDENTVEDFIRLRDRLANGKDLLDNHVVLSQFFDALESLTLQNVQFTDMKLSVAGDHTATLEMTGTAKNFNALAAQSNAFAADKRIKRAIFSDITITDSKLVSFKLSADVDSELITQGATVSAPATTSDSSVPATVTSTTTSSAGTSTTQTTP